MRRAVLLMTLPLLMAPSGVTTQERPLRLGPSQRVRPVPEGDTVRVWAPDFGLKKTKVTVLGWADSTVLFEGLRLPPDSLTIPFGGVTRLDVLRGKKSKGLGILRGAGIGGGIGVLAGLLIGEVAVSGCTEAFCELDALNYMFGWMLLGAGVGAGVGASYPPDRWVRVDLPVQAGFPSYRTPFHETFVFKLLSTGLSIALLAIIN